MRSSGNCAEDRVDENQARPDRRKVNAVKGRREPARLYWMVRGKHDAARRVCAPRDA